MSELQQRLRDAFEAQPVKSIRDGPTPVLPPGASDDDEVVESWKRDGYECEACGHFIPTRDYVGHRGCPECATVGPGGTVEYPHDMQPVREPAETSTLADKRGRERPFTVDYIADVTVARVDHPTLGPIDEITVTTTVDRYEWTGRHSQAIYEVLDDLGVPRPHDSKTHGVQFDGNDVSVTAYRPVEGEPSADGGVALLIDTVQYFGYAVPPLVGMSRILTDLGEEWYGETAVDGVASTTLSLYNDGTDAVSDTNDIGDITTEPSGASFARQTKEITFEDLSGDWGFDNDNQESFDTSDSTQTVDSYFEIANFTADDTSDTSATDHMILTGALSQSYDLSNVDTLNISAGTAGVTVS